MSELLSENRNEDDLNQMEPKHTGMSQNELIPMGSMAPGMSPMGLIPIGHKDFNEFIKGRGFVGRNNYRLKELKAMLGFKPLTYKNHTIVDIDDGKQLRTFESISKASIGFGIPYTMLIHARKKSKLNPNDNDSVNVRSGGNKYVIKFTLI